MKQKNLILVAVAVGCGLVAAILTTQLSAGPRQVVEQVEIPVAAKPISLNKRLTKEDLDPVKGVVKMQKFPKDALPPQYVAVRDDLLNKTVTRAKMPGEFFNPKELSDKGTVELPSGYDMITFPVSRNQIVGGFAVPGSRVDILAAVTLPKSSKAIVFPLLIDVLVMAIDIQTSGPANAPAYANVGDVSVAVTKNTALIIHAAINRGANMRLILRNQGENPPKYAYVPTEDEVWAILSGDEENVSISPVGQVTRTKPNDGSPVAQTVDLPVPVEDLPVGTRLTKELLDGKFKMVKITPPAPIGVVADVREYTGQYLTKEVAANQFIPLRFLAEEMPKPGQEPKLAKPAPSDDLAAAPKEAPGVEAKEPPAPVAPPVYHHLRIVSPSGVRTFRYLVKENGEHQLIGEVREDRKPKDPKAADPTSANSL